MIAALVTGVSCNDPVGNRPGGQFLQEVLLGKLARSKGRVVTHNFFGP